MIPLNNEEKEFYSDQKECYICKKKFYYDKNEEKSEIIVIALENLEEQLIVFAI